MRICIIGMPACGKTTIGKRLSELTGMLFVETDSIVELHFKLSISEIFDLYGEKKFRKAEKKILKPALENDNTVFSAGGGLPCFFDNMNVIKENCFTVYLKMDVNILFKRLSSGNELNKRPLFENITEAEVKNYLINILNEREPFYIQADYIIDANDTIENICKSILFHIKNFL